MANDVEERLATQLRRIEAVHRGFLFQHLFAVGCLFLGAGADVQAVRVEQDEDIELDFAEQRRYVQVKTRKEVIDADDIETTLTRFRDLNDLHVASKRPGKPDFWLVGNVALSQAAIDRISAMGLPMNIYSPGAAQDRHMPPPWQGLADAIDWCRQMAAKVPFTRLAPDTLVWKLASEVAFACTGARPQGHSFDVDGLKDLFEQFASALQRLPSPPDVYRPQVNEPTLESDRAVRLIVGHSGGGKTAWAAANAVHAVGEVVYFDTAGVPSGVAPSSVAREFAARLLPRSAVTAKDIFLPGATGFDSLRLLAHEAARTKTSVILIFDNAQITDVDVLRQMVAATPGC